MANRLNYTIRCHCNWNTTMQLRTDSKEVYTHIAHTHERQQQHRTATIRRLKMKLRQYFMRQFYRLLFFIWILLTFSFLRLHRLLLDPFLLRSHDFLGWRRTVLRGEIARNAPSANTISFGFGKSTYTRRHAPFHLIVCLQSEPRRK